MKNLAWLTVFNKVNNISLVIYFLDLPIDVWYFALNLQKLISGIFSSAPEINVLL